MKGTTLNISATVLMLVGLVLTFRTFHAAPTDLDLLERRRDTLEDLRREERSLSSDHLAVEAYEALPRQAGVSLKELVASELPSAPVEIHEQPVRTLRDKWVQRTAEVILEETHLAGVGRFLDRAESERPPWRLESCSISATDDGPGKGRVNLVVSLLERQTL